jgi:hypothetical protein
MTGSTDWHFRQSSRVLWLIRVGLDSHRFGSVLLMCPQFSISYTDARPDTPHSTDRKNVPTLGIHEKESPEPGF